MLIIPGTWLTPFSRACHTCFPVTCHILRMEPVNKQFVALRTSITTIVSGNGKMDNKSFNVKGPSG